MIRIEIRCDRCGKKIEVEGFLSHERGFVVVTKNGDYYQYFGKFLCSDCSRELFNKLFYGKDE